MLKPGRQIFRRAVDVVGALPCRPIDNSRPPLLDLATGESLARGEALREIGVDGVRRYRMKSK